MASSDLHIISTPITDFDYYQRVVYRPFDYLRVNCERSLLKATIIKVDTYLTDHRICGRCLEQHQYGSPGRTPFIVSGEITEG